MTLLFQILIGLALLIGLVAIFLSTKNWHWTQVLLVTCLLFAGLGVLYMATKTVSLHKELRAGIPRLEKQIADFEKRNELLIEGTADQKGIRELDHRLQIVFRERGRVWRQVRPAGQLDNQGRVKVEIPNPQPHGLEQDAIIYAFEAGPPDNASVSNGPQFLGEYRVVAVDQGGATLEPINLLTRRSAERLARSNGPWSLYETMPADRHKLFADFSDEELEQMLPASTVAEYQRHGDKATEDDKRRGDVIGLNENDERVGPDNIDQAVKTLYDRPLRDYAFLFSDLAKQYNVLQSDIISVNEDNNRLKVALKSAEELTAFREEESEKLTKDLAGMEQDRKAIEAHRDQVATLLANAQTRIEELLAENSALARRYTEIQQGLMEYINATAPQPAGSILTGP